MELEAIDSMLDLENVGEVCGVGLCNDGKRRRLFWFGGYSLGRFVGHVRDGGCVGIMTGFRVFLNGKRFGLVFVRRVDPTASYREGVSFCFGPFDRETSRF